jgi:hypothetical protein
VRTTQQQPTDFEVTVTSAFDLAQFGSIRGGKQKEAPLHFDSQDGFMVQVRVRAH